MSTELAITWFLTFFPITISPGPANLLLSSTSARFGARRTLPLMWGIFLVFVGQIILIGLGLGEVVFRFPRLFTVFKIVGALYLFYLAWRFFRSTGGMQTTGETKLGFREGALLQFFNFKALTVPLILYTQFLDPTTATRFQIVVLTLALFGLAVSSLLAWLMGGTLLQRLFQSEFGTRWQGKIFGVMLAAVAVWILFR